MLKKITLTLLIISTISFGGVNSQIVEIIKGIGQGAYYIFKTVQTGKQFYEELNEDPETRITNLFASLKDTLSDIKDRLTNLEDESENTVMKLRMNEIEEAIAVIDDHYDDYLDYTNSSEHFSDYVKDNFATFVLDPNTGIPHHMVILHSNLVGRGKDSLVKIMQHHIENLDPFCRSGRSRQRYFYHFFLTVMATYFKAYLVMDYAISTQSQHINVTMDSQRNLYEKKATTRLQTLVTVFNEVLSEVSRDIWKCDPQKSEENVNYFKLDNVFRYIIYDDKDFRQYRYYGCPSQCPVITKNLDLVAWCHEKDECTRKQRRCENVVQCNGVAPNESYGICVVNKDTGPRITSIVDQNKLSGWETFKEYFDMTFASGSLCETGEFSLVRIYSKGAGGPVREYCVSCECICDEKGVSDRYFSLKPMTSDVHFNKVVTGVRFIKENNTISIQIQEAKLLPGGFVSDSNVKWQPLNGNDDYKTSIETNEIPMINHETDGSTKIYENFKLEWYGKRGLYLDDIELPMNEVVTGIKFAVDKKDDQQFLKIDIQSTKFDYQTGKLYPNRSYWYSTKAPELNRTKLDLSIYDTPVSVKETNKPDDEAHQYTFITPSRLTSKDIGQNVIPFFDAQPVASSPAAPLSGISLDIKRAGDSGGYLMLKIKTYNVLWLKG